MKTDRLQGIIFANDMQHDHKAGSKKISVRIASLTSMLKHSLQYGRSQSLAQVSNLKTSVTHKRSNRFDLDEQRTINVAADLASRMRTRTLK